MCIMLQKSGIHRDTVDEFEALILICLQLNICSFDNKTFKFPSGVPMGGPLSSVVADVLMDTLEWWVLEHWAKPDTIILWYRFVDDIFCVWRGSDSELDLFHEFLHFYDDSIKFTLEIGGASINYLDLTVSLSPDDLNDGCLTPIFSVYRKPTYTGLSIHSNSWHPSCHKYATIRSAVNRMLSLPLNSDAEERETQIIEHIALLNGLKTNVRLFINRCKLRRLLMASRSSPTFPSFFESQVRKAGLATKFPPPPPASSDKEVWLRLPYLGRPTELLERELKRFGYRVGFYPLTKIIHLSKLKDVIPPLHQSGIYSLLCPCGDTYIG